MRKPRHDGIRRTGNRGTGIALLLLLLLTVGLAACSGGTDNKDAVETGAASPAAPTQPATPTASASLPSSSSVGLPSTSSTDASEGQDEETALVQAFEELAQSDRNAAELNRALDDKLAKAQPETGDAVLRAMLDYYDRSLPDMQAKFEPENVQQALQRLDWPPTDAQIGKIKDKQVLVLVQNALGGGYKLETTEGMYFPVVDYGKLKRADARVTAAMKDYIALLAVESDQKSASDDGLVIDREEVAARAVRAEKYVAAHPDSPERIKAEDLFAKRYIPFLLKGLSNTPVFDFDTFQIDPQVKKDLQSAVADYPGTVTAKLTQQFLDVLDRTDGAVYKKGKDGTQIDIPEVKAFYDGLEPHARELLDGANPNK